jgi:hypothetical protein
MTDSPDHPESVEDGYPDDLVAAVRAAQLRICTQAVPKALDIRLKAAAEARAAGVREWYLAGNREARPIEQPYLRVQAATATSDAPSPKSSGRRRPQKKKQ